MKREDKRNLFVGVASAVVLVVGFLVLLVDPSVLMPNSVVGLWGGAWEDGLRSDNDEPPAFAPTEWNFNAEEMVYITMEEPTGGEVEIPVIELRYSFDGTTVRIADTIRSPDGPGSATVIAELEVTGDDMSGELLFSERGEKAMAMRVTLQRR